MATTVLPSLTRKRRATPGLRWWHAVPRLPGRVAVLMYHRVHPDPHVLNVHPERFAAQMALLRELGEPIALGDLVDRLRSGFPLPSRAIVVTFDDGYRDNATHALPILKAHGIPATFFLTASHVGTRTPLWWDRVRLGLRGPLEVAQAWPELGRPTGTRGTEIDRVIRELKKLPTDRRLALIERICRPVDGGDRLMMTWDEVQTLLQAGMEVGSHTFTHPILARTEPAEARREIAHSKTFLEERLGVPIRHFAYPNGGRGDFTPAQKAMVAAAGYESAVSTVEGLVSRRSHPFALERMGIDGYHSLTRFALKVLGWREA